MICIPIHSICLNFYTYYFLVSFLFKILQWQKKTSKIIITTSTQTLHFKKIWENRSFSCINISKLISSKSYIKKNRFPHCSFERPMLKLLSAVLPQWWQIWRDGSSVQWWSFWRPQWCGSHQSSSLLDPLQSKQSQSLLKIMLSSFVKKIQQASTPPTLTMHPKIVISRFSPIAQVNC